MTLAPPYDFAVLENGDKPRSLVYDIDSGDEVATFDTTPKGQRQAEVVCSALNELDKESN